MEGGGTAGGDVEEDAGPGAPIVHPAHCQWDPSLENVEVSQMRIFTYKVSPFLPERLARLEELAQNLWWSWHHEAIELFLRLDPALWEAVRQNPVRLLGEVAQERLEEAADDEGFLAHLDRGLWEPGLLLWA